MSLNSYFFNAKKQQDGTLDRLYNAEAFTNYLQGIVANGVYPNPSTCLQVYANGDYNVAVKPGQAWINGHKVENTTDYLLTVEESDVVLNRIDRVVLQLNKNERDIFLYVKKGKSAADPIAPELTRDDYIYELCLAEISVGKQQEEITDENIRDTRLNSEVCGIVAGLIKEVDTTTLWKQFEEQFKNWFDDIKNLIATGGSYHEIKKLYITNNTNTVEVNLPDTNFRPLTDILNIYINGLKLNDNEYSVDGQKIKFVKAIDIQGTPIEVSILKVIDPENRISIEKI